MASIRGASRVAATLFSTITPVPAGNYFRRFLLARALSRAVAAHVQGSPEHIPMSGVDAPLKIPIGGPGITFSPDGTFD